MAGCYHDVLLDFTTGGWETLAGWQHTAGMHVEARAARLYYDYRSQPFSQRNPPFHLFIVYV
jgi:hypothetical protein